jgi:hypothetical protein
MVGAGWSVKGGKQAVPWSKSPNAQSESWCRRGGPMVGAGWSKGGKQAVPWSKSPNAQSESWCRRGGPMVGAGWSRCW